MNSCKLSLFKIIPLDCETDTKMKCGRADGTTGSTLLKVDAGHMHVLEDLRETQLQLFLSRSHVHAFPLGHKVQREFSNLIRV